MITVCILYVTYIITIVTRVRGIIVLMSMIMMCRTRLRLICMVRSVIRLLIIIRIMSIRIILIIVCVCVRTLLRHVKMIVIVSAMWFVALWFGSLFVLLCVPVVGCSHHYHSY